jgi:hypothetical protein
MRRQAAIARKRGRAGGCDASACSSFEQPKSSQPTTQVAATQPTSEAHASTKPPCINSPIASDSTAASQEQAVQCNHHAHACASQGNEKSSQIPDDATELNSCKPLHHHVYLNDPKLLQTPSCMGTTVVQQSVDEQRAGADDGPDTECEPPRKRSARMKEVEELLAIAGDAGQRNCRASTRVLGPKPAPDVLDAASLQSIREELDAASAAAKQQFKSGVCSTLCRDAL